MEVLYRILCVAVTGVCLTQTAVADGNIYQGRILAETHCARCHVIGDFNKFGGIGSTPSFRLLRSLDDGMERFQTFYERRPHPVFVRVPDVPRWSKALAYATEFTVTPEAIEDLLAFVKTMKQINLSRIPVIRSVGPSARKRLSGSRLRKSE